MEFGDREEEEELKMEDGEEGGESKAGISARWRGFMECGDSAVPRAFRRFREGRSGWTGMPAALESGDAPGIPAFTALQNRYFRP